MFYRVFLFTLILPALAFSYTVVRKDGKSFSGELIQQTPQATVIKDGEGVTIRFRADQIDWDQTTMQIQKEEEAGALPEIRFRRQEYHSKELTTREKMDRGAVHLRL